MAWGNQKGMAINRYPICAAFYATVAQRLGYTQAEAESLGLARATFFAAAKNGFRKGGGKKHGASPHGFPTKASAQQPQVGSVNFAGLETQTTDVGGEQIAVFGGQKMTEFASRVRSKIEAIKPGSYAKLEQAILAELSQYSDAEINTGFAYKLYEKLRDTLRTETFYGVAAKKTRAA